MRRSYIVLLSIVALIIFYSYVLEPVQERHEIIVEELEAKSETLHKYKKFLNAAPNTEEEINTMEKQLKRYDGALIDVQNDTLGFARLNTHLDDLITQSGIEIISIKPLNVVKYKLYVAMPLQINATGDIKQLTAFLRALSSGKHLATVDTVDIRVMNVRTPDKLRLKIQVSGYREI